MSEPTDRPPTEVPGTVARRRQRLPAVPIGFRPAPSDDALETNILERWQGIGLILTIFLALFLPAYWLFFEPQRGTNAGILQRKESIERGGEIFAEAPKVAEPGHHGFNAGCALCHGANAQGGISRSFIPPGGKEPQPYTAPPLNDVFIRKLAEPTDGSPAKSPKDAYNDVYESITEGRLATDAMPAWALANGGPLNDQQITDVINFIISLQDLSKLPKGTVLAAGAHEGSFSRLLALAAEQR